MPLLLKMYRQWLHNPIILMVMGMALLGLVTLSRLKYIQDLRSSATTTTFLKSTPSAITEMETPAHKSPPFRDFRHQCYSLPDFSEFCLYENVCWGGDQLLIPAMPADHVPSFSETFEFMDDTVDNYMNYPLPGAGELLRKAILPRRSFLKPAFAYVEASVFGRARRHETFAFLTGFDSLNDNLFHFAESVLLYHALRQMNGTFLGRSIGVGKISTSTTHLPALSAAIFLRPQPATTTWISRFAHVLFGPKTSLIWSEDAREYTKEIPLCFDRLMVSGTIIHLTLGVRDAEALRDQVGRALGLPRNHLPARPRPPQHIVVERRRSRSWTNHEDIMDVVRETGVSFEETSLEALTFEEQVQVLNRAGVFVSAHGAGMTNLLWMPTGGAVVEAFSSKAWQYNLYGEIARNAGLFHQAVHGNVSSEAYGDAGHTPVDCLEHMPCNIGLKQDFFLKPDKFRKALHNALSLAGIKVGEARS